MMEYTRRPGADPGNREKGRQEGALRNRAEDTGGHPSGAAAPPPHGWGAPPADTARLCGFRVMKRFSVFLGFRPNLR